MLSLSVPQPVNTTSPGRQPTHGGDRVAGLVDEQGDQITAIGSTEVSTSAQLRRATRSLPR